MQGCMVNLGFMGIKKPFDLPHVYVTTRSQDMMASDASPFLQNPALRVACWAEQLSAETIDVAGRNHGPEAGECFSNA